MSQPPITVVLAAAPAPQPLTEIVRDSAARGVGEVVGRALAEMVVMGVWEAGKYVWSSGRDRLGWSQDAVDQKLFIAMHTPSCGGVGTEEKITAKAINALGRLQLSQPAVHGEFFKRYAFCMARQTSGEAEKGPHSGDQKLFISMYNQDCGQVGSNETTTAQAVDALGRLSAVHPQIHAKYLERFMACMDRRS